jgi:hypothetical protein
LSCSKLLPSRSKLFSYKGTVPNEGGMCPLWRDRPFPRYLNRNSDSAELSQFTIPSRRI